MNIGIFGLGYVGVVSAALLARRGHRVTGIDVNPVKVTAIGNGESPIEEPGLAPLVAEGVARGLLAASTDAADGIRGAELILVCVGTPSDAHGRLDTTALDRVVHQVADVITSGVAGAGAGAGNARPTLTIRSTVPPGTLGRLRRTLHERGIDTERDLALAYNPEFLREGCAVRDYEDPPFTVVGADDDGAADALRELYAHLEAPFLATPSREAEMLKMVNNAFHALKVAFANEVGTLARAEGVDGRSLMELVCRDRKLNISPTYLRPGFAFGGSCLPKDLRALNALSGRHDLQLPLLAAIESSNDRHVERATRWLEAHGRRPLGLVGLAFKGGTDDLRESPLVRVAEWAVGKGYPVSIYDRYVLPDRLTGANRQFIEERLPHLYDRLQRDLDGLLATAELVVVGASTVEPAELRRLGRFEGPLLDLTGYDDLRETAGYEGVCW